MWRPGRRFDSHPPTVEATKGLLTDCRAFEPTSWLCLRLQEGHLKWNHSGRCLGSIRAAQKSWRHLVEMRVLGSYRTLNLASVIGIDKWAAAYCTSCLDYQTKVLVAAWIEPAMKIEAAYSSCPSVIVLKTNHNTRATGTYCISFA